ncbi:MAG: matrixin family metalloprotease [Thermoanaerobaculia bacterium]
MLKKAVLCVTGVLALLAPASWAQTGAEGDPYVLAVMNDFNGPLRAEWMDLRAEWMDLRIEQVELLTLGQGRASSRLHRQPFRWVAGDPRRAADGANLTYLVDLSDGLGATGLTPEAAEAAVDRAAAIWSADECVQKLKLVKRPGGGLDADIFDSLYGYGGFGDYRAADVVSGGWLPPDFFERVTGPGGGQSVVALSVTFIYVGRDGLPSDINGDGFLDTAHSEIYFNQGFSWLAGGTGLVLDPTTVALHELGHALGIGHLGPPPTAVMNPVYAGPRTALLPLDHAALCSAWSSWPR